MPRLFVAIDLPSETLRRIAALQPDPRPALRVSAMDQMHLTLHFIGDAEIEPYAQRLALLSAPSFELTFSGLGHFAHASGARTLWLGVFLTESLSCLHRQTAALMEPAGFREERRPYTPHITLARSARNFPEAEFQQFAERSVDPLPAMRVRELSLYSSFPGADGPTYHREATFTLPAHVT